MANLQVKNLPEELNQRLHRHARAQRRPIREVVIEAVERELDRHTFVEKLRRREPVQLKSRPATLLAAERRERGYEP
jgi:plasmid stability protein